MGKKVCMLVMQPLKLCKGNVCVYIYVYVYVFSDLWIWNFHHSNFLLTNAFIYLYPMRLSLGKRPSQLLEHRYLLNETIFQEKKTAELQNYMACDQ